MSENNDNDNPDINSNIINYDIEIIEENEDIIDDNNNKESADNNNTQSPNWLYKIYGSHTLSTWGDRSWEFLIPVALAEIFPYTLLPVSLILFFENIMGSIFISFMGTLVDKTSRISVIKLSLIIQNLMVFTSSLFLIALWWIYYGQEYVLCDNIITEDCFSIWSDYYFLLLFSGLCLSNALSMLFSVSSSIAVERDWIVVLCEKNEYLLIKTNSVMQRIDLICKVGSPAVLGFILQVTPLIYVLIGIALWNIASLIPELYLLLNIYYNYEDVLKKDNNNNNEQIHSNNEDINDIEQEETVDNSNNILSIIKTTLYGWKIYFTHHVFLASLSYVMLYCTILAPGGLFNAYLKVQGIQDWMLGTLTGFAAIIGLSATYIQPRLSIQFGSKATGTLMLWMQFLVLMPVVFLMYFDIQFAIYLLMILVAFARFPLWAFDLVERQIMQLSISEKERGIVNSVESSMTKIATLLIYLLGSIFSDPNQFIFLALFSVISVTIAALLFSAWNLYNTKSNIKENTESTVEEIEMTTIEKEGKNI